MITTLGAGAVLAQDATPAADDTTAPMGRY